ncbi:MAG: hypothetical protein QOJ75_1836, partial [Chloroflexota bacterium]|nr:hypothetical protein [Chloroflexota bacterium]
MTEDRTVEHETTAEDGVVRRETVERDYTAGADRDGDEEAGGAVGGGVAGAAVGAVVGGPVGAVVGGAIGAATGATAGLVDEEAKDHDAVTTHEV